MTTVGESYPSPTVVGADRAMNGRAWLEYGRVVKMTSRALARFMSFPDSYALPKTNSLATTILGNAVPPLLGQAMIESVKTTQEAA
jgi:site-specific DNA-cytosine methylase